MVLTQRSPGYRDNYQSAVCLESRARTTIRNAKASESKFPTELKNARWEGLSELAKTAAADVINAKSAEATPVRLVEGVKGIGLKLQCHTLPVVKMEQLSE
jgi:hypothetical protein